MSLYNLLFGENSLSPMLLAALGVTKDQIPRYRDCYYNDGEIVIYTRTGGGNRDYYDSPNEENTTGPWNSDLRGLPGFKFDEDDDFDSTYAYFHFKCPATMTEAFSVGAQDNRSVSEKFQDLCQKLESGKTDPQVERALEVGRNMMKQILPIKEKIGRLVDA